MMKRIWHFGVVLACTALSGCFYSGPCLNGAGPVISEEREVGPFTGVANTGSFDVIVSHSDTLRVEVRAQESLLPIIETYVAGNTLIVKTENNTCFKSNSPIEVYVSMPETDELSLEGSGRVFADMVSSEDVEISNNGSGRMEIESINCGSLDLGNSGSGSITVTESEAVEVDAIQSGSGSIDFGTLRESRVLEVRHSSSGRVSGELIDGLVIDVVMSGSGRTELRGVAGLAEYTLNSSGRIDALDLLLSDADATNSGSGDIFVWATDELNAIITGSGDILYKGNPLLSVSISGSGSVRPY